MNRFLPAITTILTLAILGLFSASARAQHPHRAVITTPVVVVNNGATYGYGVGGYGVAGYNNYGYGNYGYGGYGSYGSPYIMPSSAPYGAGYSGGYQPYQQMYYQRLYYGLGF